MEIPQRVIILDVKNLDAVSNTWGSSVTIVEPSVPGLESLLLVDKLDTLPGGWQVSEKSGTGESTAIVGGDVSLTPPLVVDLEETKILGSVVVDGEGDHVVTP
ncbi:unnamed protein product [Hermetia illucens]|uniref:Uncharacterized protein n=1 Tax=Hermetia illucens TaxID=343691 RepID=A0A7R8YXB1_HERIL|nr:unnamed protein product [Hermetia illucens]